MATVRMSARGTRAASTTDARPSMTTVMRRSFSVSCASGVMCPPLASITDSPRSSTRASVSVMISNRFIEYDFVPMAELRPSEILLSEEQIQKRVREMALEIRRDYPDDLHVIAVLKGAFIFLSDLARHIPGHV